MLVGPFRGHAWIQGSRSAPAGFHVLCHLYALRALQIRSWELLLRSWCHFGGVRGRCAPQPCAHLSASECHRSTSGSLSDACRSLLDDLGSYFGASELREPSFFARAQSTGNLRLTCAVLEPTCAILEPTWAILGPPLGPSCAILGLTWTSLRQTFASLRPN